MVMKGRESSSIDIPVMLARERLVSCQVYPVLFLSNDSEVREYIVFDSSLYD